MAARLVSCDVSLDPNPGIGILFIRVISTVSTATGSVVVAANYTGQPILFNPVRDLGSLRNASRFFSGQVAGYLGRNQESIAPITFRMAAHAFRVFMSQGRTCGVQIYAEFEVVCGLAGFLDGGALVLDSLPYQENFDYVERPPDFVGLNRGMSAGFEAAGFMDGGALVLDSLPQYEEEEEYDSVDGIIPNFVLSNRGMSAAEISKLKKVTQSGGGGGTCAVCLDDFSAGDLVTPLTPCSHSFHAGCIAIWLRKNPTCPMCRRRCTVL